MKLRLITICEGKIKTFYKGMTASNFEKFKRHSIPGFLSDLSMALIYADPKTMPKSIAHEPRVIIAVDIDTDEIADRRCDIGDMCGSWQNPSHPLHNELRSSIWWSTSGGHGNRGIYCGKPMPYRILFIADPDEYYDKIRTPEIKAIIDRNKHLDDNKETTWHEFS